MPESKKASKSSRLTQKRKDKLFSSSDSSEFDSDDSNTLNLQGDCLKVLADKTMAPEVSTPAVKNLIGDSTVLGRDKTVISNPPLVTTATDDTGSDSSSGEHSDGLLVTGTKSVLPNIVHNDSADITSFAYDETLLVENNRVSGLLCLYQFVGLTASKE